MDRGHRTPGGARTSCAGKCVIHALALLAALVGLGIILVELQGDTVDAITRTRRLRSVREHVTEMRVAFGATNLGATHEERPVVVLADRAAFRRCIEPRSAGA